MWIITSISVYFYLIDVIFLYIHEIMSNSTFFIYAAIIYDMIIHDTLEGYFFDFQD